MSSSRFMPHCDKLNTLVVVESVQDRIELVTGHAKDIPNILFDEASLENFTASYASHDSKFSRKLYL
jgi:hypothetical protein